MSDAACEFQVRDRSLTAPFYRKWLWHPIVEILPRGVPANGITLVGNAFSAAALVILVTMPPGSATAMLAAAACIFIYFTLDSVDGPQARKTNTCSPAGELLDHWLDVWGMGFLVIGIATFLQISSATWIPTLAVCSLGMFAVYWEQYHTGWFLVGRVGANEVLTVVPLILVAGAVGGVDMLLGPCFGPVSAFGMFWGALTIGFAWVVIATLWKHPRLAIDLLGVMAHFAAVLAWWWAGGLTDGWLAVLLLSVHGLFCGRLLVCRFKGRRFAAVDPIATSAIALGALGGLVSAPATIQFGCVILVAAAVYLRTLEEFLGAILSRPVPASEEG